MTTTTMSVAQTATLVHGYSLARVDRLSHEAARKAGNVGSLLGQIEAREEAWSAIVETLYLCPEKPSEWSLVEAGTTAIARRVGRDIRETGLRQKRDENGHGTAGYETAPGFQKYWITDDPELRDAGWVKRVGAKPDWTDSLVDRMALPQMLATLSPAMYEAVAALAAFMRYADEEDADGGGTAMAQAASFLGISYTAMTQRLSEARKKMLVVWYAPDTPPGQKAVVQGGTCKSGHPRAEHGYKNSHGNWACRRCKRNSVRRQHAKGQRHDGRGRGRVIEVVEEKPVALTFAPASTEPPRGAAVGARFASENLGAVSVVIGSTACWCGLDAGHDWPHKGEGAPHPSAA